MMFITIRTNPIRFFSKSFFKIGPLQHDVQSLFAISSFVALSRIAVLIFSPALINFCYPIHIYFNTSEKLLTCFPKLCVKSGALKLS